MKFLCLSDQIDPLVYSKSITERFGDVDIILFAGDLPSEYIDFVVSSLNAPSFFVFGNHELGDLCLYHREFRGRRETGFGNPFFPEFRANGASYTGFKMQRLKAGEQTLLVAGASGSIRYNNGLCQYTNQEMFFKLLKLLPALWYNKIRYGRYLDIFLTHAPPWHIHDLPDLCHRGFKCFRWFMKRFTPAYMIHGHIHLYDLQAHRRTRYHDTDVVNAYGYYVFDLEIPKKPGGTGNEKLVI
ncbi:MAG: metallophosphoesterase [Treponema sp.]|jgi:Icc-related predicted phosphoesterase|nr:metallophosphoesterase [Treponema sp.]